MWISQKIRLYETCKFHYEKEKTIQEENTHSQLSYTHISQLEATLSKAFLKSPKEILSQACQYQDPRRPWMLPVEPTATLCLSTTALPDALLYPRSLVGALQCLLYPLRTLGTRRTPLDCCMSLPWLMPLFVCRTPHGYTHPLLSACFQFCLPTWPFKALKPSLDRRTTPDRTPEALSPSNLSHLPSQPSNCAHQCRSMPELASQAFDQASVIIWTVRSHRYLEKHL